MNTRRQDFSEHKEIICMAFRAKMNQEVLGNLKTNPYEWKQASIRSRVKVFLNWLRFETKLVETQVEWISGLYTLRVEEI